MLLRVIVALALSILLVACEQPPPGELCPGCDPASGTPARTSSAKDEASEEGKTSAKIDPASSGGSATPAGDDAKGAEDDDDADDEEEEDDADDADEDEDDEDA